MKPFSHEGTIYIQQDLEKAQDEFVAAHQDAIVARKWTWKTQDVINYIDKTVEKLQALTKKYEPLGRLEVVSVGGNYDAENCLKRNIKQFLVGERGVYKSSQDICDELLAQRKEITDHLSPKRSPVAFSFSGSVRRAPDPALPTLR